MTSLPEETAALAGSYLTEPWVLWIDLYVLQIDRLNLLVAKGVLEAGPSHFSKRPALSNVMVCPISSEIFTVVYPVQLILIILMPMQRD
jgi:hypothetical protein